MADWDPTPVGSLPPARPPEIPPTGRTGPQRRPWTIGAAIAMSILATITSFLELDARTGEGATITLGGPAFMGAIAIGLAARWRSAWWAGVATAVLGLVLTPFLLALAGGTYALVNAAFTGLLLVLLTLSPTRAWLLDRERTELHLGSLLGTIVVLSIVASIAVGAT